MVRGSWHVDSVLDGVAALASMVAGLDPVSWQALQANAGLASPAREQARARAWSLVQSRGLLALVAHAGRQTRAAAGRELPLHSEQALLDAVLAMVVGADLTVHDRDQLLGPFGGRVH